MDPVDLPIHCAHGGRAVWLQIEGWNEQSWSEQSWTCPYGQCRKTNQIGTMGRVVKAIANYGMAH
jgi:hypothetical protein